jgi:penicillin-binding protein 1A
MSDTERILIHHDPAAPNVVPLRAPARRKWTWDSGSGEGDGGGGGEAPGGRGPVRVKKLRVFALLVGLGGLACISTLFGMMMAVAAELPALEEPASRNSVLLDADGRQIGLLTGNERKILLREEQIAPVMKHAMIAIEDRRFFTNEGVDVRGIARALWQDIRAGAAVQGGSTITQQFVKNALAAQDERTLLNKVKEAALAFHITRKWPKQRILRNYLNTIYFGNGAYGIEAAARTYFGRVHTGCEETLRPRPCAAQLEPHEAALLAGMVASPSAYDPLTRPARAKRRRDLVLARMREAGYLTAGQLAVALAEDVPTRDSIQPPSEDTEHPYFTSWVKQQVVDELGGGQTGAHLAFDGGLRIRTTLDSKLQKAAQGAVDGWLGAGPGGPRASLVAIENRTGEVKAMIGGDDYDARPFNLATQGRRQPGSAFKPFVLARALEKGVSPDSVWSSRKQVFDVPGSIERFSVENYEDTYAGQTTLARATTFSDNSVYAQVGIQVGTRGIARLARKMGIRTPVSRNWAMTLGGLRQGVTPLDLAHAYQTFAQGGLFTYGTLSPGRMPPAGRSGPMPGPVGIKRIEDREADVVELPTGEPARNERRRKRVLEEGVARTVGTLLQGVVRDGTGQRAAMAEIPVAGKTGTTENYGDAWFVGWTREYTVAVWVGYPDGLRPMRTEFRGEPVAGGTFPALIWKAFMEGVLKAYPSKKPKEPVAPTPAPADGVLAAPAPAAPAPAPQAPAAAAAPAARAREPEEEAPATDGPTEAPAPAADAPAPAQAPAAAPEAAVPETGTGAAAVP